MDYKKMPSGHGTWGWCELTTTDTSRAKDFYSKLFGWTTSDMDLGPAGIYTIFSAHGETLGGMMKDCAEGGAPTSMWTPYVQVESLDEAYANAKEMGATTCVPPSPVPNIGRFAVIQDPTGATIALIQYD
jgi:predicted enzyme related to lactoylglutathione lyase